MDLLESQVKASLERAGYLAVGTRLVLAVSGGPDSMALLHALVRLPGSSNLSLHVAHFNHDFRGEEADMDAQFVADTAQELGLKFTVEKGDPVSYQKEAKISSFEEAARELRYGFLGRVSEETGAAAVALGHTTDDLAETVLMHILRGSGMHGLRSMTEVSRWSAKNDNRKVILFRPLLQTSKQETLAYCRTQDIKIRVDSGNSVMTFTRNRVRHGLLPVMRTYNPKVTEALTRLARSASLEVDYLEGEVDRLWPGVAQQGSDSISFDKERVSSLHPLIQRLILRRGYQALVGDTRLLGEVHINAMTSFLAAGAGKVLHLPKGLRLQSGYKQLVLVAGATAQACPFPLLETDHILMVPQQSGEVVNSIPGWKVTVRVSSTPTDTTNQPFDAIFDARAMADNLRVRTRLPGDRFQPLGMNVSKKLQDFYVDQKVPRSWRDRIPLVVTDRGIAWVVGYRVAEWASIMEGPTSSERVEIKFELSSPST